MTQAEQRIRGLFQRIPGAIPAYRQIYLIYGDDVMEYANQGKMFCVDAHRAKRYAYSNRVDREDWKQRRHFGEISANRAVQDE